LKSKYTRIAVPLLGVALFSTLLMEVVAAGEEKSATSISSVAEFVKTNMIGRVVETRATPKVNGKLASEFLRRVQFTNLEATENSVSFDQVVLIKQTLWDLDESGNRRAETEKVVNRTVVFRIEAQPSKSTGRLLGKLVLLTSSVDAIHGQASAVQMMMDGSRLKVITSTPLYGDGYGPSGTMQPTATTITATYELTDGKLSATSHEIGFDVNPDTLEKAPNGHDVTMIGHEIETLF